MKRRFAEHRSEAGETLIEVLISSVLMALVVVAIIGGITTMLLGSSVHRGQADANSVLVAAMERLKSPGVALVANAQEDNVDYLGAAQAAPPGTLPQGFEASDITIAEIAYQAAPNAGEVEFSSAWDATLPLQLITLRVEKGDGINVAQSLSFVKGAH